MPGSAPHLRFTLTARIARCVDFPRSTENSTKLGVGLPLGVEYGLGPGLLFGEVLLQWGPLDHEVTGETNLGTATLWLGYRAVL